MTNEDERRRIEAVLERRFLSAGGTSGEWQEQRSGLVAAYLRDRVLSDPIPAAAPTPRDLARPITADDEAAAILSRGRRL